MWPTNGDVPQWDRMSLYVLHIFLDFAHARLAGSGTGRKEETREERGKVHEEAFEQQ